MLKRTFRNASVIAGLIERNYPGKENGTPGHFQLGLDLRYAAPA